MKKCVLSVVVCVLFFVSCKKTEEEKLTFQVGEETIFETERIYTEPTVGLTIKIYKISDSRCPVDVNCFWQGEAKLSILVSDSTEADTVELSTFQPQQATWKSYSFQVNHVAPYPVHNEIISLSDYLVTLIVTTQ